MRMRWVFGLGVLVALRRTRFSYTMGGKRTLDAAVSNFCCADEAPIRCTFSNVRNLSIAVTLFDSGGGKVTQE